MAAGPFRRDVLPALVAVVVVVAFVVVMVTTLPDASTPAPCPEWPAIVRTVDGTVTTPMPEDLDR